MSQIPAISALGADSHPALSQLFAEVFGPGRFARAAYRVREAAGPQATNWFGVRDGSGEAGLIGAVGMTPVSCGAQSGVMLGPIAVRAKNQRGLIGSGLMNHALAWADASGFAFVILVGDLPYYERFGFARVPFGQVTFPGPVDPARVLARCCAPLVAMDLAGEVRAA